MEKMSHTIRPGKLEGVNKSEIKYLCDVRESPEKIPPADAAININVEDSLP